MHKDKHLRLVYGAAFISVSAIIPTIVLYAFHISTLIALYSIFFLYGLFIVAIGLRQIHHIEAHIKRDVRLLVKKEDHINTALVRVNTEEKLKNVLSLDIERCVQKNSLSQLVLFDIDDLGKINDRYGYNFGDNVIIEIVLVAKSMMEENATLARIKGDTFAILMPNATEHSGYQFAEKLKHSIEALSLHMQDKVTCRFAIVSMDRWSNEDDILSIGYDKLKLAKEQGKGSIV